MFMRADDFGGFRPDERGGIHAVGFLGVTLVPDGIGQPPPEAGSPDLSAPIPLDGAPGAVHGDRNGLLGGDELVIQRRLKVLFAAKRDPHAATSSAVQISRSASRSGSPWTM